MKYAFLFCGTVADQAAYEALTPEELKAQFGQVGRWFLEHEEVWDTAASSKALTRPRPFGSGQTVSHS